MHHASYNVLWIFTGGIYTDDLAYLDIHFPASLRELLVSLSGTSTSRNAFMQYVSNGRPSLNLPLAVTVPKPMSCVRLIKFLVPCFFGYPNAEYRPDKGNKLYLFADNSANRLLPFRV